MIFHSSFENIYLWLPLIGFLVGLISTLIGGGGGGFFFIPVLIFIFGIPAHVAITTSLAATLPICLVGSIACYRNGHVDLRLGLLMSAGGILGALAGAGFISLISQQQLIIMYGFYSVLLSVIMLRGIWQEKRNKTNGVDNNTDTKLMTATKGTLYGFLAGVITASSGTTGATPVQAGLFAMRKPVKVVIGTSLMVVMANTASGLGAHFLVGKIDLTLIYFLTSGTILGALLGPKVIKEARLEHVDGPIRFWYAISLIVFGIAMIISAFTIASSINIL
ncbi:MAG: sulfite exporter TauE/SafE family protein [Bacteroidales bacterium]|nr:sulfite exporter TauE/SafE family protein [Bacteroidales bacterium]